MASARAHKYTWYNWQCFLLISLFRYPGYYIKLRETAMLAEFRIQFTKFSLKFYVLLYTHSEFPLLRNIFRLFFSLGDLICRIFVLPFMSYSVNSPCVLIRNILHLRAKANVPYLFSTLRMEWHFPHFRFQLFICHTYVSTTELSSLAEKVIFRSLQTECSIIIFTKMFTC
jgi:hypothetical protein